MNREDLRKSIFNDHAFTLLELLVVIAIIGILATIAIPMFSSYRQKAYNSAAISDLKNFKVSVEAFEAEEHQYPSIYSYVTTAATLPSAATELASGDITTEGVEILGATTSGGQKKLIRLSSMVKVGLSFTKESYAIATKHTNGSMKYGLSSDATAIYTKDIGATVQLEAPSATDSSAFADWSNM